MLKEVILFIFIAIFIGLSQTAGVGGGPIINILLMMSMGYQAKISISVTYIFLIGGSIASMWKNSKKKNPRTNRTYVSLDLIRLTLPIMISGAIFGSIIKNFISQLVITVLFIFLFAFLAWDLQKTVKKIKEANNASLISFKSLSRQEGLIQALIGSNRQILPENINSKVIQVLFLCVGFYAFTIVLAFFRGGLNYGSVVGLDSCGMGGWIIIFIHFGVSVYWSCKTTRKTIQENNPNSSRELHDGKVQINQQNIWRFIIAGFLAGVIGVALAIGGTVLLIPIWLKLGVDKDVAASSTPPLILISSLMAFTISMFNGYYRDISLLTLVFYFALAFISSVIVKDFLTYMTAKYKLKAMVVELLLIVVVISLVGMVTYQFSKMGENFHAFMSFGTFC